MSKAPTFREIVTSIRKKSLSNVYLLMGDEPYYLDKIVEALEENVIAEEYRDFNSTTFYGAEVKPDIVIGTAQQLPMMSERQLVILKEAQAMQNAKSSLEKFAPYLEHPNPQTILAIVYKGDNLNTTSRLMKVASKSGAIVFKSPKLREYQLAAPIKEYCTERKVTIDDRAIEMLGEYIGTSLEALSGAIDKIIIAKGSSSSRIHPEDVAANIGLSKEYNSFELVSAIGSKNHLKAQMVLRYFRQNPKQNPMVVVSSQLFNYFSKIVIAHLTKDKSDTALMAATGTTNAYAFKQLRKSMQLFNFRQAMQAIGAIRDFDARSKGIGSTMNEQGLLSELVFTLFTCTG